MRHNAINLFCGNRRTGKSDLAKQVVKASPLPKKLIIETFETDIWENLETHNHPEGRSQAVPIIDVGQLGNFDFGVARCFNKNTDLVMDKISSSLVNTLVVFEDASKYFSPSGITKFQREFVLNSKNINLDLVIIFHIMRKIPAELLELSDYLTIFKTGEKQISRYHQDKFPDEAIDVWQAVKASKNQYLHQTVDLRA